MDEYEPGELRLLGGFRGQQPVGLFPVFVREKYSLRFVVSPPPGLSVPWLGPVLMPTSPKQRKREKLNERFTEAVLEAVDVDSRRTLFGMVGTPKYGDPRPYLWENLNVDPRFNFILPLEDRDSESVLGSFTRDLRKEIRKGKDLDISITLEGAATAERICDDLKRRHAEQGLTYPTPRAFARDLVSQLDGQTRVYVARTPDGEFLSGITLLYANGEAMFWQGGAKANYQGVSVNSLLHWEIITDILDDPELESVERYHLGNALNRRISRFKSKFNGDPVVNYEIKSNLMLLARKVYTARRHVTLQNLSERF
ncbi:GNAT family N-acetyltransferase [Haloarcula marina]|uniref:GNAT family N-acetyltransferase n=1 Tax=Haloarcula marina TaxID=2961574 RepID=UPI0020B81DA4|nr:GNAT family N-acetyltransferase [Halomicroarcula marina]